MDKQKQKQKFEPEKLGIQEAEMTVTECFNCGHEVTLSTIRLEAMKATEQDVYCEDCDDDVEIGDEMSYRFVPFF